MNGTLDAAVVARVRELMGDDFGVLLSAYLRDAVTHCDDLGNAIGTMDLERVSHVAHSLKGMSLNIGARALAATLSDLEAVARRSGTSADAARSDDLVRLMNAAREQLSAVSEAVERLRSGG